MTLGEYTGHRTAFCPSIGRRHELSEVLERGALVVEQPP
jgi:hypothetical protein